MKDDDFQTVLVSREGFDALLDAIDNPKPPPQALIDLMRSTPPWGGDIPPALKRDANNVAPFMLEDFPNTRLHRDMVDVKFSQGWAPPHPALCVGLDLAKPGADRSVDVPPLKIGPDGNMSIDGKAVVGVVIDDAWLTPNPEANPPETPPSWVPPWASKS